MPYPYQISGVCFASEPFYTCGPYDYGGNRYVVLQEHNTPWNPSGVDKVRFFKSTDAGATWAEQDSANAKSYYQSDTNSPIDAHHRDGKLYVTYVPSGGTPGATALDIAEINLATDLWGTVITGGPVPGDNRRFKSFKLGNGDIRTVFTDLNGSSRLRVKVATYSGGSWGSATTLFDPGVSETSTFDYTLQGVALDEDDNLGILCHIAGGSTSATNMRYRHYSSAGVAGTYKIVPYISVTLAPPPLSGPPATIPLATSGSLFVFPAFTKYSTLLLQPGVIIVDPGADPPGIRFSSLFDATSSSSPGFPFGSSFYVSSQAALFHYWAHFDGSTQFRIKRACTKLAEWAGPTTVFTPSALSGSDNVINSISAMVVGSNADKVGIVFSSSADNGSGNYRVAHYYEEDLPTCSASGFGGTAQNHNGAI